MAPEARVVGLECLRCRTRYDEPRMFIYAFSVIDMQLMHGTRAAIPGIAFQDEAGWYIDVGFDHKYSAAEDWYSVAGLLGGGR